MREAGGDGGGRGKVALKRGKGMNRRGLFTPGDEMDLQSSYLCSSIIIAKESRLTITARIGGSGS